MQRPHTQRSWQTWWRQEVWTPSVQGDVLQHLRVAATALGGMAIAAGAALVSAHTIVPPLLALTEAATGLTGLFDQWPIIGPMLSSAIGVGGIFGYIAVAAVLTAVVATLLTSEGHRETVRAWGLAHLALGFSLAPLLTMGTAITSPVFMGAWACAAGLSLVLSGRLYSDRTTWQAAIMGVCFGLGTAPMGAVAALGMAPEAVLGNAVKFIATGVIAAAFYSIWLNWSQLVNDSTAYLNRFAVPVSDELRLSMADDDDGTVVGLPDAVLELVQSAEVKQRHNHPLGMMRLLLDGPAGTGKTTVVQGIANHLDIPLFSPSTAELQAADNTALAVLQLFDEAREHSRTSRKPLILFFDRAEVLFTNRATLDPNSPADREAANVINVFLTCLDGVSRHSDTNLIVVAATHFAEQLDPSIEQRFLCRGTMGKPNKEALRKMFAVKWEQMQDDPALHDVSAYYPTAAQLDTVLGRALDAGLVGRDIDLLMEGIVQTVSVQHAQYNRRRARGAKPAFDAAQVLSQALNHKLDDVIRLVSPDLRAPAGRDTAQDRPGRAASAIITPPSP